MRGATVAGLARKTINARIDRIRRVWKWAAAEGLVPTSIYVELQTLDALRKNRTEAREAPRVMPVAEYRGRATLPHMPRPVAAMAELQLLTGCRVGEVLTMTASEIDRSVDPWESRPGSHKNDDRDDGRERVVHLRPRAQAVLSPFLDRAPDADLFDSRDVLADRRRSLRRVAPRYDRRTYGRAIDRACDRAFPHPVVSLIKRSRTNKLTAEQARDLKAWREANLWSPLKLGHAAATRFRKSFGLEASQALVGHARADVAQACAERLDDLARDIARTTG